MGWCAGSSGSSGLLGAGASCPPAGPCLAVVTSLVLWLEGGKGCVPRAVKNLDSPVLALWGFPPWQETFPGTWCWGSSC